MLKLTDKEREIAINFAYDLVDCGVEHYIYRDDFRPDFFEALERLPYDTEIAHGSTRGVFSREDGELDNWVLKVDFDENSWNYCEKEAEFYQKAIEAEVDWAFAATYFLATVNGFDFYIQEKLDCDCVDVTSQKLREYLIDEFDVTQREDESDEDFEWRIADWIDYDLDWDDVLTCLIGDSEVEDFVSTMEINDLHKGNYGLTKEGYFKIVDYCGYYE